MVTCGMSLQSTGLPEAGSYEYLFGPVPSRRLGRSLGIDLVPRKTCCFNCIFCQLCDTSALTLERREYVPVDKVINELERWLKAGHRADYMTLSGSGEPTLHSRFGAVIDWLRKHSDTPVALLTGGALFYMPEVRTAARNAQLVKASLSAWDESSFKMINHPCKGLTFEQLITGERAFRREYAGQYWIEVFVVKGLNSDVGQMSRIAELVKELEPDKVHLNTAVRPAADRPADAVSTDELRELAELFSPQAEVAGGPAIHTSGNSEAGPEAVLAVLRRHPSTANQIAGSLETSIDNVHKCTDALEREGQIRREQSGEDVYFVFLR